MAQSVAVPSLMEAGIYMTLCEVNSENAIQKGEVRLKGETSVYQKDKGSITLITL
jgi:hypothetical protein